MKKYYTISPMNEVDYFGEFEDFKTAWDFLEYESNVRYVWLVSENSVKNLYSRFEEILNDK